MAPGLVTLAVQHLVGDTDVVYFISSAAQEVADILKEAVATISPPGREDEEMPPTSALGKRAEHRLAEGPAKFSKPAGRQGQGSHYPPESEPSHGSGQSSDQWQDRPANPKNWTKEQTRQRQDEMWRQWESNTSWYQTQDIKKLRQEMEQLQEHVRLLARMSLRHEDELSQGTNDNSANMLVILFRMAVVWKEKK
ncbi:unnamed protein product, partial [Symbiodinium necroappetens]